MRSRSWKLGSAVIVYGVTVALAITTPKAQTNVITNGTSTDPAIVPGFLFEPEVAFSSLKSAPTWNELEQLLDNPARGNATNCTDSHGLIPGTDQGFASRCTDAQFIRRPSFGVTLPPLLVHPLNYNPTIGEQMRLLNPNYPGGTFNVTNSGGNPQIVDVCPNPVPAAAAFFNVPIQVSSGARLGGESHEIDYNSPVVRDVIACIPNTEIPEVGFLLGGDPGEPEGYSSPAVIADQLVDATGTPIGVRGANGVGGLRKPSLRIQLDTGNGMTVNGTAANPDFIAGGNNLLPQDATDIQVPSNENDYIKGVGLAAKQVGRLEAMALGKALFWDMQVGSDGVQSCGSCHFHAGADNRTKNQMNPNHIGGDSFFEVGQSARTQFGANHDLVASDFPIHKLTNNDITGDPKCAPAVQATINAGVLENNLPNGGAVTVCDAGNIARTSNDVASSMGVKFGKFNDIPAIGTFITNASGVNALPPDLRSPNLADNTDPIPGFAGTDGSGHEFRRVEPRNTPTLFAAAFNFDNFWDGRARHDFNGGSVFGAADPQGHVWVNQVNELVQTRQIVRFASLASLATGPALSEFEMSRAGRNWPKIGKKLLQGNLVNSGGIAGYPAQVIQGTVTPLANQLVAVDDSILGRYSNQGGSDCAAVPNADRSPGRPAVGKPGLCISYPGLIRRAFHPRLWNLTNWHVHGHAAACATSVLGVQRPAGCDPFDGYVLGEPHAPTTTAHRADTNTFSQMEANMSLFFGLSVQLWGTILVPDDTPLDQFLDANPDAFANLGEAGEPGLVGPQPVCTTANQRYCFTEVGNFKRDADLNCSGLPAGGETGGTITITPCQGTRTPGQPDPLLGADLFFGSNMSLKNPNFRAARCGECHAMPTLTDNTVPFTFKAQLGDFVAEFLPGQPGIENPIEPLGRSRIISGFLLEGEFNENGQDGVERRIANQSIVPNAADGLAYPDGLTGVYGGKGPDGIAGTADDFVDAGAGYFDNGVYNIGVTPCEADPQGSVIGQCDDLGRGGDDAFGWPLSLAAMMLKKVGGPDFLPGNVLSTFTCASTPCDPIEDQGGGLFEETGQDQGINPGLSDETTISLIPTTDGSGFNQKPGFDYLAPFLNEINVGDAQPELDEVFSGLNTLTDTAILEGFLDSLGPFNPAGVLNEALNLGESPLMGSWPFVNRVGRAGSMKAPQLREIDLTGPYFHNGGKLTLRQVVDFYARGGDFPVTNAQHRDFNIVNLNIEVQSNLTEEEKVALVDFLLELTDDRVRFERAPFDHPEVFVPLDGRAPENTFGRPGFLANLGNGMFRQVPAVGAGGSPTSLPRFLGLSAERLVGAAANCDVAHSQYCR